MIPITIKQKLSIRVHRCMKWLECNIYKYKQLINKFSDDLGRDKERFKHIYKNLLTGAK